MDANLDEILKDFPECKHILVAAYNNSKKDGAGRSYGELTVKELESYTKALLKAMEEYAKQKLSAIWNFEGLPKEDKPVLIFRGNHTPEVVGAFYEGNVEHGEFHNGEECPERIVYSDVTAWTDVLEAPKLATDR